MEEINFFVEFVVVSNSVVVELDEFVIDVGLANVV